MSKPTAKAMRAELKKPAKPKFTQEQKDAAELEKRLSSVKDYCLIDAKRTSKDACVAAANEYGVDLMYASRTIITATHLLDVEIREHKKTKKALAAAQKELKALKK